MEEWLRATVPFRSFSSCCWCRSSAFRSPRHARARPGGLPAGRYIVTFADDPVASYDGYEAGFPATRPQPAARSQPDSAGRQELAAAPRPASTTRHLAKVGATKLYDYTVTNNGVAAEPDRRAGDDACSSTAGVVALSLDQARRSPTPPDSPSSSGSTPPAGCGRSSAGPAAPAPGSSSASSTPASGRRAPRSPAALASRCPPTGTARASPASSSRSRPATTSWSAPATTSRASARQNIDKSDYLSPRDGDGHGSHTASTAAGNHGTDVTIDGKHDRHRRPAWRRAPRSRRTRSAGTGEPGIAPGCFNSDSVAAINDAVLDGVDVINYSIGGSVRVRRARPGRAGVPRRVQRRRLRRQLGRQQRPRARARSTTRRRG